MSSRSLLGSGVAIHHADAGILVSELTQVVDELQSLVGAPLYRVWVPTPTSVVVAVGRRRMVYLEVWPLPRLHTIVDRPPNPPMPYSFQGLLRARLGGRLEFVRLVGGDRVVELGIGAHTLHARLFGRGGGLWLLEGDRVLAAADGPASSLPPLAAAEVRQETPRFEPVDGSWDLGARAYFEARAESLQHELLMRRVTGHLKRLRKKQRRLVRNLEGDLDQTDRVDALRHEADCLGAALHTLERGQQRAEIPDVLDPSRTLTVELDPRRSPAEEMNRRYDKAGRLERAAEQVLERLAEAEETLARTEDDLEAARDADDAALRRLVKRYRIPPDTPRRVEPERRSPWWAWEGPHGEEVLVGKGDKDNHELTFHHARGRDWWFHLRDLPGAHVILRRRRDDPAPDLDLLLDVAQIVLATGRVPEGASVDVQYARAADLRPVKGGRPGQTQVLDERVLHVKSDPSRLARWRRA